MRIRDIRGEGVDIIPNANISKIEKQGMYLIIDLKEGYFIELDSLDIGQVIDALKREELIQNYEDNIC